MSSALYASLNAALADAASVTGQTFIWRGKPYACVLSAETASIVVQKSLFAGVAYPRPGDIIGVTGKDRPVTSVANASAEFVPGGLIESGGPFVDDPSNPALSIRFDTFING